MGTFEYVKQTTTDNMVNANKVWPTGKQQTNQEKIKQWNERSESKNYKIVILIVIGIINQPKKQEM